MTDRDQAHRRSLRLNGFDYAQPGAYFVTAVTFDRRCLFGNVCESEMRLNDAGRVAFRLWEEIPVHFPTAELDAFVVMPNHVHGIIVLASDEVTVLPSVVGATHASPVQCRPSRQRLARRSIGAIVGSYKSAVSRCLNRTPGSSTAPLWQRNYYEHIIRGDDSLRGIREYIEANPAQWTEDRENPLSTVRRTRTG